MAHPQTTPRGVWAAKKYLVGSSEITFDSTGLVLSAGIKISDAAGGVLTANATELILPGAIKISNVYALSADSTGIVFDDPIAGLPGAIDGGAQLAGILNSTGNFAIGINTTGTDWKFLLTTSILPT